MKQREFRKLNMEVPVQPLHDQRPWMVAGLFLVVIFLLVVIYAYLKNKAML